MILPIYIYNDKTLMLPGESINKDYPDLPLLIDNMFETMYQASGIGLAAHQIGKPIKLFIVDITNYKEGDSNLSNFKKVFINSEIIEEDGDDKKFDEGCLSFPGLTIPIIRKDKIKLKYSDENFIEHEEWFDGLAARVIQHEHDHTNGMLFNRRTSAFYRELNKGKINDIIKRNFLTNYRYKK